MTRFSSLSRPMLWLVFAAAIEIAIVATVILARADDGGSEPFPVLDPVELQHLSAFGISVICEPQQGAESRLPPSHHWIGPSPTSLHGGRDEECQPRGGAWEFRDVAAVVLAEVARAVPEIGRYLQPSAASSNPCATKTGP